jgi:hypothetical protein
MKYLKFYEAFQSKGIGNTLKFLKDKVGKQSSDSFINSLRDFMTGVDFPIDKLSDSNIKYLSAKKAIQLRCESPVTNERGIWVIKYWFSIERGFLGYTATGNKEEKEIESSDNNQNGLRDTISFTDRDIQYIKDRITPTGEIWKVLDYNKLQTGDTVIGEFDSSIAFAKIFVDRHDNRRTYAIQSVASGSEASNPDWTNYRQYGGLSWWIFDNTEMGNDHRKLHYWKQSSNELHYVEPPKEESSEEKEEKTESPLIWNLPLSNRLVFSRWGRGSSIGTTKDINEADFALVLYFDELINPESDAILFEKPSETKQQRRTEKEGATKLMSDAEIKKMNIERYIQKLVVSLNITETDFFNLEKIVSKHLAQEFSYISIYHQRPDWSDLTDFTDYLYQVVDSSDKEYYINRVKDMYKRKTENYYNQLLRYQTNKTFIKGDSPLKKIFDEIFKLGSEINVIFTKKELNTIDDLWLTSKKIRSLYEWIKMSRNQFNYQVRELLSGFRYTDETSYYFSTYDNQYTEEDYKQDLEKINRIRSFIKTL